MHLDGCTYHQSTGSAGHSYRVKVDRVDGVLGISISELAEAVLRMSQPTDAAIKATRDLGIQLGITTINAQKLRSEMSSWLISDGTEKPR